MANKAKKEFRARVRKMQKHLTALLELAATERQRDSLYRIQAEADGLQESMDREFDEDRDLEKGPPDLGDTRRADPRGIAN